MANPTRIRKRVTALRRASDGSAFQKCDTCGVSVAIALVDMHECELKSRVKRFKAYGDNNNNNTIQIKPSFRDQPRSPFCLFMESFMKAYNEKQWLEAVRKGFETWKNMSDKEKHSFIIQAEEVNFAYEQALLKEVENAEEMDDDEADSAMVGKFNPVYKDWEDSDEFDSYLYKEFESLNSYEWKMVRPWVTGSTSE